MSAQHDQDTDRPALGLTTSRSRALTRVTSKNHPRGCWPMPDASRGGSRNLGVSKRTLGVSAR